MKNFGTIIVIIFALSIISCSMGANTDNNSNESFIKIDSTYVLNDDYYQVTIKVKEKSNNFIKGEILNFEERDYMHKVTGMSRYHTIEENWSWNLSRGIHWFNLAEINIVTQIKG